MTFEITYIDKRPKRVVTEEHFNRSRAFYPVLQMEVGQITSNRYRSAGYKQIKRVS